MEALNWAHLLRPFYRWGLEVLRELGSLWGWVFRTGILNSQGLGLEGKLHQYSPTFLSWSIWA